MCLKVIGRLQTILGRAGKEEWCWQNKITKVNKRDAEQKLCRGAVPGFRVQEKLLVMLLKTYFRTPWSQCKDLCKCGRVLVKNWCIHDLNREQNSELCLEIKLSKGRENYPGIIVCFETQGEKIPKEVRNSSLEVYCQTTKITQA